MAGVPDQDIREAIPVPIPRAKQRMSLHNRLFETLPASGLSKIDVNPALKSASFTKQRLCNAKVRGPITVDVPEGNQISAE